MSKATTTKSKVIALAQAAARSAPTAAASQLIDARIKELTDWRGETLARVRAIIKKADPDVVEEWKWRGVPVWSHAGIICTGETYKAVVKMTFAKGASLDDPSGLSSIPASTETRGEQSMSVRATRSTKKRWSRSFARRRCLEHVKTPGRGCAFAHATC